MTEADWLASDDPEKMLGYVRGRTSRRKQLLFACGCCRVIMPDLGREVAGRAIEVGERLADPATATAVPDRELRRVNTDLHALRMRLFHDEDYDTGLRLGYLISCLTPDEPLFLFVRHKRTFRERVRSLPASAFDWLLGLRNSFRHPSQDDWFPLIYDIFGNPFRPVAVDPCWLTTTVVALADTIYADRAFDRLPILADALQDAGCEDAQVLAHCRGPGPHVRGCWVVDLVAGRG